MPIYKRAGRVIHHIHIPKCGGTSLARMLKNSGWERCDFPVPKDLVESDFMVKKIEGDLHTSHAHKKVWERWNAKTEFQFAVSRNPYERFNSQVSQEAEEMGVESFEDNDMIQSLFVTFAIIMNGTRGNKGFADNHYRRQVDFLGEATQIYRLEDGFESLVSDLISRDILADNKEILELNKRSVKIEVPWEKAEYQEVHQLFKDYYEKDFETLGYDH